MIPGAGGGYPPAVLRGQDAQRYLEGHHPYHWEEMLAFPKHLDIDPINTCNARCTMCGIDFDNREKKRMAEPLFDKIVAELERYRYHIDRVGLAANCEPLMDRRLAAKIAKLKDAGIGKVSIITNASLLTAKRAAELLTAGLDQTYISIDSLDPATFARIRRNLDLDVVYRNTRRFLELKEQLRSSGTVRITMVQTGENDEQAEAFLAHWQPLLGHRDQVVVTRGFNWGIAGGVTSLAATERLEHNRVPCISLWTSFVIDVDGQVRMCCADPQGSSLLGDVRESTIAEIWHGAELDRLRRLHLDGRRHELPLCDGCPVWSTAKHALKQPGAAP